MSPISGGGAGRHICRQVAADWKRRLENLDEAIAAVSTPIPGLSDKARNKRREELRQLAGQLQEAAISLDPVLRPSKTFDPSQPDVAGHIVAMALVAQPRHRLDRLRRFYGSGVYALYYKGGFLPYAPLVNKEHPIYVGKAQPATSKAEDPVAQGLSLHSRLSEHARNIAKAISTLAIEDFECRFLIVQSGFESAAERYLISLFEPIWNSETKICYGLGKHGDDPETRANGRSPWDTLHPGRAWADASTRDQKPKQWILDNLTAHFESKPLRSTIPDVLTAVLADLRQIAPEEFLADHEAPAAIEVREDGQDE